MKKMKAKLISFGNFILGIGLLAVGIHIVWAAEVGTVTPAATNPVCYGNNNQTAVFTWTLTGSAGGGTNTGGAALSTTDLTFLRKGGYYIDHVDIIAGATGSTTNTDLRFNTTTTDNTTDLLGDEGVDEVDATGQNTIVPAIDGVPVYRPMIDQFYIETAGNSVTSNQLTVKLTAVKK